MHETRDTSPPATSALRYASLLAIAYLVIALLYITLSDQLVAWLDSEVVPITNMQTLKGWGFVLVTAVLLWLLTYQRNLAILRSQRAYDATHRNLEALFKASPSAIIALDQDGRVLLWNHAAERLFGWSASDVVGRQDPTVPANEDAAGSPARCAPSPNRGVVKRRTRNGGTIDVALAVAPLTNEHGSRGGVVYVMNDATLGRRVEQLERERRTLLESRRAMDQVLGVVGHELRTPLAGVRALSECLVTEFNHLEPEQARSFIRSINEEIIRLTEMVNNMLEAARLDSGIARWNWTRTDLKRICNDAIEVVRPLANTEQISFELAIHPDPCPIQCDANAIRRLLLNLLSNALKHTDQGTIRVEAREMRGPDHRWVQIRVEDTGRGIEPEMLRHLGRAFATNRGSIRSCTTGVGLGLAICREIVAAHGGQIYVDTAVGRGTTFSVLIRTDLDGAAEAVADDPPLIHRTSA